MNAHTTRLNIVRAIMQNGWLCYHAGKPDDSCPWGHASNGRKYWLRGWNCARIGCQKPAMIPKGEPTGMNYAILQPSCEGCG